LGEAHLRRILRSYACYYNDSRKKKTLDDAPIVSARYLEKLSHSSLVAESPKGQRDRVAALVHEANRALDARGGSRNGSGFVPEDTDETNQPAPDSVLA
jgi:hypothetical protein